MNGVNDIRSAFLDYFKSSDHEIISSGPLIPRNDPSLMFVNAGMVQFKNVFTGLEKSDCQRAATSQKCLRAGGKHNDLDNVGHTARHHTFFEMLGNFSFGDYFKERAIELAWNLLTREFGLPKEKLLATVYHNDDKAFELWKKISGLPDERIIRIASHDNFWSMGDTGPCGPCSEVFYDHGEDIPGGPPGSAEENGDRFTEIWNLVFMQYDQISGQERANLPKPSIDTGMGLERMAAVMQGVHDNYDIDLFKALIAASEDIVGIKAEGKNQASHRIIADHLRASAFLVADGVLPSNEGRGYVLRRIMRRAMRHVHLLGTKEPLMHRLTPALIGQMGAAFAELKRGEALITETLLLEETRFRATLERGLGLLEEASDDLNKGDSLDGETAFRLYDTYGFPLDLTQESLRQRGVGVDEAGFDKAMARQKREARAAWTGSGETVDEAVWFSILERHGPTEYSGYDTDKTKGIIQAIVIDGEEVQSATEGQEIALVVSQTSFYAESGGQVGDTGRIIFEGGSVKIRDTKKKGKELHVHFGIVEKAFISKGSEVTLKVDSIRRADIGANHSATHLLHEALRQTLGAHVTQKGSLVASNRLRFDFSHAKSVSSQELTDVEAIANQIARQASPVKTRLMTAEDAIKTGAMALFGEKYGDEVRVVSMGKVISGKKARQSYSMELCGGVHVANTGQIGTIKILGDSAVSSGVRRIEAVTGDYALKYLEGRETQVNEISALLKVAPEQVVRRVMTLIEERKRLERELTEANKKLAFGGGEKSSDSGISIIDGVKFMGKVVENILPGDLKSLVDNAKDMPGIDIVAIASVNEDGKASIVVGVSKDITNKYNAVDLVRIASVVVGGKGGGGRPDMAQAGGPQGDKAKEALDAVWQAIQKNKQGAGK